MAITSDQFPIEGRTLRHSWTERARLAGEAERPGEVDDPAAWESPTLTALGRVLNGPFYQRYEFVFVFLLICASLILMCGFAAVLFFGSRPLGEGDVF